MSVNHYASIWAENDTKGKTLRHARNRAEQFWLEWLVGIKTWIPDPRQAQRVCVITPGFAIGNELDDLGRTQAAMALASRAKSRSRTTGSR